MRLVRLVAQCNVGGLAIAMLCVRTIRPRRIIGTLSDIVTCHLSAIPSCNTDRVILDANVEVKVSQ